jgi:hypothetical protein
MEEKSMSDDLPKPEGDQWELVSRGPMDGKTAMAEVYRLSLGCYTGHLYAIFIPGYGYRIVHAPRYQPPHIISNTAHHRGLP